MKTFTAFKTDKARFIAGLEWVKEAELPRRWKVSPTVRRKIELNDANRIIAHSAITEGTIHSVVGVFAPNPLFSDEGAAVDHSLAVAFVHAFPEHTESILAWRVTDSLAAVIIVQNGVPVVDVVQDEKDAIKLMKKALNGEMGATNHALYTNVPAAFLNGQKVESDQLAKLASKATKLRRIPPRPAVLVGAAAAVAVIGAGGIFYQHKQESDRLARLAAQQEAEDPLPPYQAMLATSIGRMGLERKALSKLISEVGEGNVWTKGWILGQIECTPGQCTYSWKRDGGITAALLAAYPKAEVLPESTSEEVKLRHVVALPAAGLASPMQAIPKAVAATYVNVYQTWRNAKVLVNENENLSEFKVWPTPTQGNIRLLPPDQTLKARAISAVVPMALAQELVESTPPAVWWTNVKIVYSPGDVQKLMNVTLTGNTYVR